MWRMILVLFPFLVAAACGPLQASCRLDWDFILKCTNVKDAIVDQINKWGVSDGCPNGGPKCLYKLKSQNDSMVTATHNTLDQPYVEDLTMTFASTPTPDSCKVHGVSTSRTWYSILDYGTNYCNLHNLVVGSGLDKRSGFMETTDNSICTQYSMANCDDY